MTPEAKRMRATVGHLGIEVSDMKKSKPFYEALAKALCLNCIYESEGGMGWSNTEFSIWVTASAKPRLKRDPPSGEEMVVADHAAILVAGKESVDAVDKTMRSQGFKALFPPEDHSKVFSPGYYSASYCDPDNYVVEIFWIPKKK